MSRYKDHVTVAFPQGS